MPWSRRDFLQNAATLSAAALTRLPFPLVDFATQQIPATQLAADPLRPQFHLLPPRNWMNDPDGPIFWRGHYHMFYQYNPNAAVWGDMHWAHAISPDMVHWKHLPIALAPTPGAADQDGCFSGSAVIQEGTPTFLYTAVKSVAPESATLRDGTHNFLETQCLATSNDPMLRTWNKFSTPVLLPPDDPNLTGFRDPCLWRDQNVWYMGIGSGQRGQGGRVLLYRSPDLHTWEYLHPLASGKSNGKQTADFVDSGDMWECPDFFPLGKKHVLLYSTERRVYWQTGEFDKKELLFHPQKTGLLDSGAFYAPKSQLDEKGRRILWGWIPETRSEAEFSAAGWAGCMSLPRILSLTEDNSLTFHFLPELSVLQRDKLFRMDNPANLAAATDVLQKFSLPEASAMLQIRFQPKRFELSLISSDDTWFTLSFDPARTGRELQLGKQFAHVSSPASDANHHLTLLLDASALECIVDDTIALTTRVYTVPKAPLHVELRETEKDALVSMQISAMKPISPNRLTT
ncbi:MAG: glycoside hydrolase family 32 protein [Candidatus Acidiferrum sp.]